MAVRLGFRTFGSGPIRVLALHDWFCDCTSWDATLPYLTPDRFTYAFADLRGYGESRRIEGEFTLEEAVADCIALTEHLGWTRYALVGHSMSSMVVQRMAQIADGPISRIVALTPTGPASMQIDQGTSELFHGIALSDDDSRFTTMSAMWGARLSESWIRFKLRRWRETADPVAAAKYVEMWGCTDISDGARGIATPMLIAAGAEDAPPFRAAALETSMLPFYLHAKLISLENCGHYPMQEVPPLLATTIERFLWE
jgi:pimeloyl-ACP methyl ester carboxylesterase